MSIALFFSWRCRTSVETVWRSRQVIGYAHCVHQQMDEWGQLYHGVQTMVDRLHPGRYLQLPVGEEERFAGSSI